MTLVVLDEGAAEAVGEGVAAAPGVEDSAPGVDDLTGGGAEVEVTASGTVSEVEDEEEPLSLGWPPSSPLLAPGAGVVPALGTFGVVTMAKTRTRTRTKTAAAAGEALDAELPF